MFLSENQIGVKKITYEVKSPSPSNQILFRRHMNGEKNAKLVDLTFVYNAIARYNIIKIKIFLRLFVLDRFEKFCLSSNKKKF